MPSESTRLAEVVANEATTELDEAVDRIRHCVEQLTIEQVWQRPGDGLNSIGNLMLHLAGNVRQWLIAGLTGQADHRDRPAEFADHEPIAVDELLQQLTATVAEAKSVMKALDATELLRVRRVQGFEVTGVYAILSSVSHFRGHTQEIIHMTRVLLGDDYKFAFVPSTPEQGAPT